jgi:hypothetical protein
MRSPDQVTPITDEGIYQNDLVKDGVYAMEAVEARERQEEMDYSEAAYVDSQYEYLLKNKDKGITLEELRRKRVDIKH